MITVKKLRELLAALPADASCHAYEGEDTGIVVRGPEGSAWFIRARDSDSEDEQGITP